MGKWICPQCKRSFARKEQSHSCKVVSEDSHFVNRPEEYRAIYEKLKKEIGKFGEIKIHIVGSGIVFHSKTTFAGFKIKKDHVLVEFYSDRIIDEFPIEKHIQLSKNRIVHFLRIDSRKEVNKQLTDWLKEAFVLCS